MTVRSRSAARLPPPPPQQRWSLCRPSNGVLRTKSCLCGGWLPQAPDRLFATLLQFRHEERVELVHAVRGKHIGARSMAARTPAAPRHCGIPVLHLVSVCHQVMTCPAGLGVCRGSAASACFAGRRRDRRRVRGDTGSPADHPHVLPAYRPHVGGPGEGGRWGARSAPRCRLCRCWTGWTASPPTSSSAASSFCLSPYPSFATLLDVRSRHPLPHPRPQACAIASVGPWPGAGSGARMPTTHLHTWQPC